MAYNFKKLNKSSTSSGASLDLNDPEVLRALADKIGKKEVPKASFFDRLLAGISTIGSVPDAIYKAQKRGSNPFAEYLNNYKLGAETAFLGKKNEAFKSTGDLLKLNNILQGEDALSKTGNFAVGLAGDILLDPTTALSFGTASSAKAAAQQGTKGLAKQGAKIGTRETAEAVSKKLGKELVETGAEKLGKKVVSEGAENVGKSATRELLEAVASRQQLGSKKLPDALKLFGKEVTANQPIVNTAKLLVNPIGEGLGLVGKGAKIAGMKVAPEFTGEAVDKLSSGYNKLFNKGGEAQRLGLSNVKSLTDRAKRVRSRITDEILTGNKKTIIALDALDQTGRRNLVNVLEGVEKPVNATIKELSDKLKSPINKLEKQLIDEGILKQGENLAGEVVAGIGEGLNKSYLKRNVVGYEIPKLIEGFGQDQTDFILSDPKIKRAMDKMYKKTGQSFIPKEDLARLLNTAEGFKGKLSDLETPTSIMGDALKKRVYDTVEQGRQAGVVYSDDIGKLYAQGQIEGNQAIITKRMLEQELPQLQDDLGNRVVYSAKEFKDKFKDIPPGFQKFNVKGVGDFVAHKDVVNILGDTISKTSTVGGANEFLKEFDKWYGMWKGSVTGRNPLTALPFNIRNAYGDAINMFLGGFNNRTIKFEGYSGSAFGTASKVNKLRSLAEKVGWDDAIKQTDNGTVLKKLYDKAFEFQSLQGNRLMDEADISVKALEAAGLYNNKTKLQKAGDVLEKITDPFGAASKRENLFRTANLFDAFAREGDWEQAGKLARMSSLDYTDLTDFEKDTVKRLVPFYSFMKKNLEFHLNNISKNPGRYASYQKLMKNISTSFSGDMTDEEREALPDWMKQGLFIPLGTGRNRTIITQSGSPIESLQGFGGSAKEAAIEVLSSANPGLKAVLEYTTGKNFFTGEEIDSMESASGTRYSKMPQAIKDFLEYKEIERETKDGTVYTERLVNPTKAKILGDIPLLNTVITQGKRVGDVQRAEGSDKALGVFGGATGLRAYEKNLDSVLSAKEKKELEEIRKMLIMEGVGKEYSSFYIPQKDRQKYADMLNY